MIFDFLLYLTGWPLALVLILGGVYFTVRTGFVQIRCFIESFRVVLERPTEKGHISSFGALMISTASRVGTGNIIGVSTAICLGGPGSVFWMWLTALIGGASAFVESTLAQIYKKKNPDGTSYGGPSFYIETARRSKPLAIIFAIALIFTYGVGYNMLASYNLQSSFACFEFYSPTTTSWCFGALSAVLFLFTVTGGGKRLVKITGMLVPFMSIIYVIMTALTLIINTKYVPAMVDAIYDDAFNFKAIFGGFSGSVIMWGLKRGLYSNEAGIGSAPNAAAAATVSHPVKQGLVQMLSVFIDTNILCTATALMCLSTGVKPTADLAGAPFVQAALKESYGSLGPIFIATAMILFAFTTLIGNFYYVENCLAYICGKMPSKCVLNTVRVIGALLILFGASMKMGLVWDIADIAQCVLAFINIPVCIIIGGVSYRALKDYIAQRKKGVDPVFHAEDVKVPHETDFWK